MQQRYFYLKSLKLKSSRNVCSDVRLSQTSEAGHGINVNLVSKSIPFYRDLDGKNLRFRILVPSTYVRISLLLDQRGKGGSVNASLLERF